MLNTKGSYASKDGFLNGVIPLRLKWIILLLLTTLMHAPHFYKDLMSAHVWRQTQTQTTIDCFYEEDMNPLHPRRNKRGNGDGIFRMEFPLMQWMVALLYKVFGPSVFLTRLFMFATGIFCILGMAAFLRSVKAKESVAFFGAWAFGFSPSFYYYMINPLPDVLALCLSLWALALFFKFNHSQKPSRLWISYLFFALAALCKLPYVLFCIVPFAALFLRWKRVYSEAGQKPVVNTLMIFAFLLLPFSWYAFVIPQWNGNVVVGGIFRPFESYATLPGYIFTVMFSTIPELMLNYASLPFFLAGLMHVVRLNLFNTDTKRLLVLMAAAVVIYYLYEANTITDVHDYYLFPFYPVLFLLVSIGLSRALEHRLRTIRIAGTILLMLLPLTCYLRMQVRWDPENPGFNKDLLTYKERLRNAVPEDSLVVAGNDNSGFIYWYYIDKKGWGFQQDVLQSDSLRSYIQQGARYLYSDSRLLEQRPEINCMLDQLVLVGGSIHVYKLKR